jgi:DNA-binding HxlR family transcriptional regulator
MTEDKPEDEFNSANAELYDTLAHPSRILILKALSDGPEGFAELKRTTGIESSGNLSFHLNKLGRLVKTDPEGKYCLTDEGKEAIRVVEATERLSAGARPERQRQGVPKVNLKVVGILLVVTIVFGFTIYVAGSFLSAQTQAIPQGTSTFPTNFTLQPGGSKVLFSEGGGGSGLYGKWQIVYVIVTNPQQTAEFQLVASGAFNGTRSIFYSTQPDYANFEFPVPPGTQMMNFSISNPTNSPVTISSVYVGLWVIVQPNHTLGEVLVYLGEAIIVVSVAACGVWVLLGRLHRSKMSHVAKHVATDVAKSPSDVAISTFLSWQHHLQMATSPACVKYGMGLRCCISSFSL